MKAANGRRWTRGGLLVLLTLALSWKVEEVADEVVLGTWSALASISWAKPRPTGNEDSKGEAGPLRLEEVRLYVSVVQSTAEQLSQRYYRPISVEELLAAAMIALAEATGERIPEAWRHDPAKWLGKNGSPAQALLEFRRELGDRPGLRGGRDLEISLRGMFQQLDPHCGFMTPQDRRRLYQLESGNFGTGIILAERTGGGPFVIADVELGSPAHWAGLRPEDRIWAINGRSVEQMTLAELESRLHGDPAGPTIRLQVESARSKQMRQVELTPERYVEETVLGYFRSPTGHWSYWLDAAQKLAYLRIREIHPQTADKLQATLKELSSQGLRGLILDLRDCPGGTLNTAVRVADLFLREGTICKVKYRNAAPFGPGQPGASEQVYTKTAPDSFVDFPLAVLIGSQTRGGGELIAAAIQDHHRGVLVGQRTYGKASVQQTMPLLHPVGQHQEIKLSVGLFIRPSGKNMDRFWKQTSEWGVSPDRGYEVRLSRELEQRLAEWRRDRDLRLPQSREVHPLDDPRNDPVLEVALRYLRKRIEPGNAQRQLFRLHADTKLA